MNRYEMIRQLIEAEDQANAAYMASQIDYDTWTKTLEEIDGKMSIVGIRLARVVANPTPTRTSF